VISDELKQVKKWLKSYNLRMFELLHYQTKDGPDLFGQWLDELKDRQAKARIAARLIRLQNGNFGDCKPVGEGVWEQRIDWGPGYRVYYANKFPRPKGRGIVILGPGEGTPRGAGNLPAVIENKRVVLLCDGGDKRTQGADISRAISRWKEWQTRRKT
jgi:putative addiction module killer protein